MYICLNRATAGGSLPLEQFVALAATVGFHGADVDLSYAETSGIAALKDLYARHKLRFGAWGLPFDWRAESSKQAEGLKKLAAQAKIAAELRIDACATWLMPSSDLPLMDNWKFHVDRLKPAAALLAQHGLRLGLEFIGPYHLRRKFKHEFLHTAGQMLELADAIGPNAGLLVNSFHCHTSGMRWEHLAQIPASRIVLVHLNDAPNLPCNEVEDGNRCLPGEGVIDLGAFIGALARTGYAGPVSLEVFSAALRALPADQAARKAWDAVRRSIPQYAQDIGHQPV